MADFIFLPITRASKIDQKCCYAAIFLQIIAKNRVKTAL